MECVAKVPEGSYTFKHVPLDPERGPCLYTDAVLGPYIQKYGCRREKAGFELN